MPLFFSDSYQSTQCISFKIKQPIQPTDAKTNGTSINILIAYRRRKYMCLCSCLPHDASRSVHKASWQDDTVNLTTHLFSWCFGACSLGRSQDYGEWSSGTTASSGHGEERWYATDSCHHW